MRTIICTTGTSIARGCAALAGFQRRASAWDDDASVLAAEIAARVGAMDMASEKGRIEASAEMNSLHRLGVTEDDWVILLATDTADGRVCAQAVGDALVDVFGLAAEHVKVRRITGLQVHDSKKLREQGLTNLLTTALEYIDDPQRRYGGEIILNPTGGFKGVVPFLSVLGMLFGLKTVYIFEFSESLVTLPPLPVSFDLALYERAAPAIRAVAGEGAIPEDRFFGLVRGYRSEERDLFLGFLECDGGLVTLSPLAAVFHRIDETGARRLRLSPAALECLERATGDARRNLERLLANAAQPLWRAAHVHRFASSDLTVLKPGNTPERLACIIEGDAVCVCCLYALHDDYERDLRSRQRSMFLSCLAEFTEWLPAADADVEGDVPDAKLAAENERLRAQLEDCRVQITTLRAERAHLREKLLAGKSKRVPDARRRPPLSVSSLQAAPVPTNSPGYAPASGNVAGRDPLVCVPATPLPEKGALVTCVVVGLKSRKDGVTWHLQVDGAGPETRGVLDSNREIPADCRVGAAYRCEVLGSRPGNMAYRRVSPITDEPISEAVP